MDDCDCLPNEHESESSISKEDLTYFLDGDALSDNDEMLDSGELEVNQVHDDTPNLETGVDEKDIVLEDEVLSDPDIIDSPKSQSNEDGVEFPEFNEERDMEKPNLFKGLIFSSKSIFRAALKEYSINEGFQLKYITNQINRVTAKCDNECGWRIHASYFRKTNAFQIKSLKGPANHKCPRVFNNSSANSTWLAKTFLLELANNEKWELENFKKYVKQTKKLIISDRQAYRARDKANKLITGEWPKQYWRLRDYCQTILETNPGSAAMLLLETPHLYQSPMFKRMFVIFEAQKKGFLTGCGPVIGLDACHLKTYFGGQLMTAVARDPNNQMYPIAIAVVEAECKDNWCWFLELLKNQFEYAVSGWVFISDRQKGLVQAFVEKMPNVEHRFCVRHLYANFKLQFKDKELRDIMWDAAISYTEEGFNQKMDELKSRNEQAYEWLMRIPPEQWTKSRMSTRLKCDLLCNNICESFNQWVKAARHQPILTMMETIRRQLMGRYQQKRAWIERVTGPLCPKIEARLNEKLEKIKNVEAILAGDSIWEVKDLYKTHVVNLPAASCICREFDVTGIPCVHALTAIISERREPTNYVAACYRVQTYKMAYGCKIFPIPDQSQWVKTNSETIMPPAVHIQPGRPKKLRKRGPDEPKNPHTISRKGYKGQCSKCKSTGHNSRTCKGPVIAKRKASSNQGQNRVACEVTSAAKRVRTCNIPGGNVDVGVESTGKGRGRAEAGTENISSRSVNVAATSTGRGRTRASRGRGIGVRGQGYNGSGRGRTRGQNYGPSCGIGNWNGQGMSIFTPGSVLFSTSQGNPSSSSSVVTGPNNTDQRPHFQRHETRFGEVFLSSQGSSSGAHVNQDKGKSS